MTLSVNVRADMRERTRVEPTGGVRAGCYNLQASLGAALPVGATPSRANNAT
jgi:hypothetical protein